MSENFKKSASNQLGYEPQAVDAVILLARKQFAEPSSRVLDASTLRTTQFGLVKGGYDIAAVDAALERLDDAFVANEAKRLIAQRGHHGAVLYQQQLQELLQGRAQRAGRNRFKKNPFWVKGYSKHQVDSMVTALAAGQQSVSQLRAVSFSPRWGGYSEVQVDAYIDRAVEYLQLSKYIL